MSTPSPPAATSLRPVADLVRGGHRTIRNFFVANKSVVFYTVLCEIEINNTLNKFRVAATELLQLLSRNVWRGNLTKSL